MSSFERNEPGDKIDSGEAACTNIVLEKIQRAHGIKGVVHAQKRQF